MLFQDKFRLIAVLRFAAGSLLPALVLAFVLGAAMVSAPAVASTMLSTATGMDAGATLGETMVSVRLVTPHAPDLPAPCADRHHSCGPGAIPAAHAELFFQGLARRTSVTTPRTLGQSPVPDVAPRRTVSLSILFRNFRE